MPKITQEQINDHNMIKLPDIQDRKQALIEITKQLKKGEIHINQYSNFENDSAYSHVLGHILHKYNLGKYESEHSDDKAGKEFKEFMQALKDHNEQAHNMLQNAIDAQKVTDIDTLTKEGVEGFRKQMDSIIKKRPGFKLFDPVITTEGHISNTLSMLFEINRNKDTMIDILQTISKDYSRNIFVGKEISTTDFHYLLSHHKNFNFMNAAVNTLLADIDASVGIKGEFHEDKNQISADEDKVLKVKAISVQLATIMEQKTKLPEIMHYATSPDYFREAFGKRENPHGIGMEAYLTPYSPGAKKYLLNQRFHDISPLEAAAMAHKSSHDQSGQKNNLKETMKTMIENGAIVTERFITTLEMRGENKTLEYLKPTIEAHTSRKKLDADKPRPLSGEGLDDLEYGLESDISSSKKTEVKPRPLSIDPESDDRVKSELEVISNTRELNSIIESFKTNNELLEKEVHKFFEKLSLNSRKALTSYIDKQDEVLKENFSNLDLTAIDNRRNNARPVKRILQDIKFADQIAEEAFLLYKEEFATTADKNKASHKASDHVKHMIDEAFIKGKMKSPTSLQYGELHNSNKDHVANTASVEFVKRKIVHDIVVVPLKLYKSQGKSLNYSKFLDSICEKAEESLTRVILRDGAGNKSLADLLDAAFEENAPDIDHAKKLSVKNEVKELLEELFRAIFGNNIGNFLFGKRNNENAKKILVTILKGVGEDELAKDLPKEAMVEAGPSDGLTTPEKAESQNKNEWVKTAKRSSNGPETGFTGPS